MCDNESVSKEHVPPQCFFPDGHKLNLITVPACSEHNLRKSKDDEYVRSIVASFWENNSFGQTFSTTKVIRSFEHSGGLVAAVFQGAQVLKLKDGTETGGITVDLNRWEIFFSHFANAIYWNDFRVNHNQSWEIVNPSLTIGYPGEPNQFDVINKKLLSLNFQQVLTSNPEIFQYFFFRHRSESYAYKFQFYEGFTVYALSKPEGVPTHNPAL
jgi:hypothetical protein